MDAAKLNFFTAISFIVHLTSRVYSNPAPEKVLGISACNYYGFLKPFCDAPQVPIDQLSICTALLWDGLTVNLNGEVICTYTADEEDALDQMLGSQIPCYVYYGYSTQQEWVKILNCGGKDPETCHAAEVKSLEYYMTAHKGIKGLILTYLEFNNDSEASPNYSENLVAYIKVLRAHFPDLKIGMEMFGYSLILYYNNPLIAWLDFNTVNPDIDFYLISTVIFNQCTDKLKVGGTTPLDGDHRFTLTKVKDVLLKANVPTDKTYYTFRLSATANDKTIQDCVLTYQKICTDPCSAVDWCADTQETFFEKGKFANEFGVGFVAANIEFNDAKNECKCNHPFAAFYSILDGFNGSPAPPACPLMNRS